MGSQGRDSSRGKIFLNSAFSNSVIIGSLSQYRIAARTVCVTCVWAGVDSAWEQEKLEARKMLENAAESHTSGARFVRRLFNLMTFFPDY
jgi:hypothetical protein